MATAELERILEETKDADLALFSEGTGSEPLESMVKRHLVLTSSGVAFGNVVGAATETLLLGLTDEASINLKYMGSGAAVFTSALYRYGRDKLINMLGIKDKKTRVAFDSAYNVVYGFGMNWIWMRASNVDSDDMLWKTGLSTAIGLGTGALFGKIIDLTRKYCYYPDNEGKLPEVKPEDLTKRRANIVATLIPSSILTAAYFYTRKALGYTNTNLANIAQNLGIL